MNRKCCLTCGVYESDIVNLTVEVVGVTVSKLELEDRQQYPNDAEEIVLCNKCRDEMII